MKQIILIRHAEKTKDDHVNLSKKGQIRANELVNYFTKNININIPDTIIAMKQAHHNSSDRPYQTVLPLSKKLGIKIHLSFTRDEIKKLINYIKKIDYKVLLICWEHSYIPIIIQELFKENNIKIKKIYWGLNPEYLEKSENSYDPIWIIDEKKCILDVYKQFYTFRYNTINLIQS